MFFGLSKSYVSFVVKELLDNLIANWGTLVQFNVDMLQENASSFAEEFSRRCPLTNFIGFIDCTNRNFL